MTEVERGGGNTDYAVILVHFVQSSHLNQLTGSVYKLHRKAKTI